MKLIILLVAVFGVLLCVTLFVFLLELFGRICIALLFCFFGAVIFGYGISYIMFGILENFHFEIPRILLLGVIVSSALGGGVLGLKLCGWIMKSEEQC